ncbi:MAG: arylamine N-acetyltransferase [candidate division Zixibacteria bacterium]
MTAQPKDTAIYERFLKLLSIDRKESSSDALRELVFAYVTRIPFENISKLYYLKRDGLRGLPDFETYLSGIERYNFGGTCYINNYHLHLLLSHLGYDVSLCGTDMENPDVHIVNIVRVDGCEFIADAGYAAPFIDPLPRDLRQDYVVELGRDRYVLEPRDDRGRSRMVLYHDNHPKHGYVVNPVPRTIDYFEKTIAESFRDSATFMSAILLTRFERNKAIRVNNLSVIRSEGTEYSIEKLESKDQLPPIIEDIFGIPQEISREAIARVGDFGDAWD